MRTLFAFILAITLTGCMARALSHAPIPPANTDVSLAKSSGKQTAVFAGGCFWGTQAVFERVKGVVKTTAGYSGGSASTATYDQVTTETTGQAESVRGGLRSVEDHLRAAAAHLLFRRARSDAAQPPGAGRRQLLPFRDLLCQR